MTPVIMDWDIHQWAADLERCGIGGTTIQYMNKLRKEYPSRFGCEPLATQIIGGAPSGNYDLAGEVFRHKELIRYADLQKESELE